jgi:signal transduction histidine kinase
VFALCSAVLLAALAWMSLTALRLDRSQREATEQAEVEERVRLALWRMDSALTALFVEESSRPANAYRAFYEAERAYTKFDNTAFQKGEVLVPSPLLTFTSSNVLLHFQRDPGGALSSPQVPTGPHRALALSGYVTPARIETFAARLAAIDALLNQPARPGSGHQPMADPKVYSAQFLNRDVLMRDSAVPASLTAPTGEGQESLVANPGQVAESPEQGRRQALRSTAELQSRANLYQQAAQQVFSNVNQDERVQPALGRAEDLTHRIVFKALWLGDELVLARQVPLDGQLVAQACWLNWTNLRNSLLASIHDLFPKANLEPLLEPASGPAAPRLAALPVKLIPGAVPMIRPTGWSPVQISLAVAWGCVSLAAVAVGLLLRGTLALSERRATFVSAVTHELRTPLTTFKMYSEMLADGMISDAAKRKSYLETLCSEAGRLSHLVENVLAYARLERGSARQRVERVTLGELLERVRPRLEQHADRAGLKLITEADAPAMQTAVHVDVSAVEQILFNLVDNACKYAAPLAAQKVIRLQALPADKKGRFAALRVRDHGPGVSREAARRLFQAFSKSPSEAARTAPGVGLGLALCHRLSHSLGGDLRWDASVRDGACFILMLPVSAG